MRRAAVGNNAPFVGLLGTVIGVLGATAIGLLVAIPAVAVFNHFQG
jgi:biopolymer transport protein ExbB/TolQ